jgi:hypothetical protein
VEIGEKSQKMSAKKANCASAKVGMKAGRNPLEKAAIRRNLPWRGSKSAWAAVQ